MSKSPLPIESSKAKIFYTSHTIEHIKEDAVQVLFNEVYRCLEDGGVFRITTGPDAETDFRALLNNDQEWFYWDRNYVDKGSYKKPIINQLLVCLFLKDGCIILLLS
jgi:predicted SAM-dependent methyltransferase